MTNSEAGAPPLHVLLVEDDDGDALLVEELLAEADLKPDLTRAWSLEAAIDALAVPVDCVLLDLGLPDASGLDALVQLRAASDAALVVLTGLDDADRGVEAVAAGAQDYLVKGRVDGEALGRAMRYAVERRRGDRDRRSQEHVLARAERATEVVQRLRATPHLPSAPVRVTVRSDDGDPSSPTLHDVVERPDGTVVAVLGAVEGAGVGPAALAATVRASFRALALSPLPVAQLVDALDRVVAAQPSREPVRVVVVELDPETRGVITYLAGHHSPLVLSPTGVRRLAREDGAGAALGAATGPRAVAVAELEGRERLLVVHHENLDPAATTDAVTELEGVLGASSRGAGDDSALADAAVRAVRAYGAGSGEVQLVLLGWAPA